MSNLHFTFDGRLPAGGRVVPGSVTVAGEPLDLAKEYSVAVLDLAAHGKEGYDVFLKGKVLRDEEVGYSLFDGPDVCFCVSSCQLELALYFGFQ